MAHTHWPLFDLVVRTPRLELRHPDDETCAELAAVPDGGLFADGENQFMLDWWSVPSPGRERASMQWWWKARAELRPEAWNLTLAVVVDGRPIGVQDLHATQFLRLRSVVTGSWLGLPYQGQGLGKEMRQAVLHLAFDGLGADEAHSGAFDTNPRSIGVSRSVGYEDNGESRKMRGDAPSREVRFRMTRDGFAARRRKDITIEGLEPCLELFGLNSKLEPLEHPTASAAGAGAGDRDDVAGANDPGHDDERVRPTEPQRPADL
jgi:RimJ/RimL family protein N-acetyltransferase